RFGVSVKRARIFSDIFSDNNLHIVFCRLKLRYFTFKTGPSQVSLDSSRQPTLQTSLSPGNAERLLGLSSNS
ncbi:hypothetical protein, partial [Desulfoplanes sp.]